jgi:hypothetical protein
MSKLKGSNGVMFTQGLFYEYNNPDAPFTLRPEDYTSRKGNTYVSFARVYRESVDEYDAAMTLLNSWVHWQKLCKEKWFQTGAVNGSTFTGLNDWREEKEKANESAAKRVLLDAIADGDTQSAWKLYDKVTKKEVTKGAGRPEKKIPTIKTGNVSNIAEEIRKRSLVNGS